MNEMVERVARAIKWSRAKDEIASTDYRTGVQQFMRDIASEKTIDLDRFDLDAAKAAIAAMLEPTDEMKAIEGVHWGYGCHVCGGLTEGWHAMIDAALKEG